MVRDTAGAGRTARLVSGEHERRLAVSALAQQVSHAVAVVMALVSITVLARRLSLSEFGTYGLLVSLTTYLLFIQGSVETAAVKAIAQATDPPTRDRAFSTAVSLYSIAGVASGVLIAGAGTALLGVFKIPGHLHYQAQLSVLVLGALTGVGWPFKAFQDVLRGSQNFVHAAVAESIAYVVIGATLVGLALSGAELWLLVAVGASIPLAIGTVSATFVLYGRLPYRYRRRATTLDSIRGFLGLSTYLFLMGLSGLVIYSLDRAILGVFRPAATVGLYEGPIRAHNLVAQINSTFAAPVLPAATRYLEEGDTRRTRDLLLRGTRYTLAAIVPVVIVLTVLARPILEVWLGAKFDVAATAMTLLTGYWLVNATLGVAVSMLVAAGRARQLAVYAAVVAALNLTLSLVLTPRLGLNGVVLGTTISYLLLFPIPLALTISTFPVSLKDFAREAWLPAYITGAFVAGALVAVRLTLPLDTLPEVVGAALLALLAYWGIYYIVWLRPNERVLVRNVVRVVIRH
jgi:O-antigen/teichoic acid export membrane protein